MRIVSLPHKTKEDENHDFKLFLQEK